VDVPYCISVTNKVHVSVHVQHNSMSADRIHCICTTQHKVRPDLSMRTANPSAILVLQVDRQHTCHPCSSNATERFVHLTSIQYFTYDDHALTSTYILVDTCVRAARDMDTNSRQRVPVRQSAWNAHSNSVSNIICRSQERA
jgi:hypothetical protein